MGTERTLNPRLRHTERIVLGILFDSGRTDQADDSTTDVRGLTHARIAELGGLSAATVRRSLRRLAKQGKITEIPVVSNRKRLGTIYRAREGGIENHRDRRAAALQALDSLQSQLAALDAARQRTAAAIEVLKRLL
jgi:DNA-binding Lrp family transcriptional regulator